MPVYKLADGSKVELPEDLQPEELAWLKENKAVPLETSGAKDVLKGAMSGITEGLFRAPLIGGDIINLGGTLINKIRPGTFDQENVNRFGSQAWIDAFRGSPEDKATGGLMSYEPETRAGRYTKAGTSAIAGGAATGGMASIPGFAKSAAAGLNGMRQAMTPASMAINGAAGVASEAGTDVSGNPLVGLAAGLGVGTAGTAIRHAMSPNFVEGLYDGTKTMKPGDWQSARRSLDDFRQSGSTSFTLADLPELQPRIGGNARDITNTTGGEALRAKFDATARRGIVTPEGQTQGDIPNLLRGAANVVPPVSDPRELAVGLAGKGQSVIKNAAQPIYNARDGGLDNLGNVDPIRLLAATNRYVRKPAIAPGNQSEPMQAKLRAAEEALLGRDAPKTPMIQDVTPPVLNVRSLSQNVKSLRANPTNSTDSAKANINRFVGMEGADAAERALDKATKGGFSQVMSQYRASKENILDPMKRGLPGTIQEAKDADSLLRILNKVPEDKLLGELNTAGVTPAEAKQLARIVGDRLEALPDATKAANTTQLANRRLFNQLLEYADPSLKTEATRKIKVADALARLDAEHSADSTQRMTNQKNWAQWGLPFSTAGFRNSLRVGREEAQSMSQLLANPTPENLEQLRKISLLDPRAKKFLDWYSAWGGAATSSGSRE